MSGTKKDLFALLRWIQEQGFAVLKTKNGHYRITGPHGVAMVPSTPGEGRSHQNTIAQLRRAGVNVPRK